MDDIWVMEILPCLNNLDRLRCARVCKDWLPQIDEELRLLLYLHVKEGLTQFHQIQWVSLGYLQVKGWSNEVQKSWYIHRTTKEVVLHNPCTTLVQPHDEFWISGAFLTLSYIWFKNWSI